MGRGLEPKLATVIAKLADSPHQIPVGSTGDDDELGPTARVAAPRGGGVQAHIMITNVTRSERTGTVL